MTIEIDYKNEHWDDLNMETGLRGLASLCGEKDFSGFSELTGGLLNKVFLLYARGRKVVAKISPLWNQGGLAREVWCYQQIQNETSFKTAKVFSFTQAENSVFPGHEIVLMEYLPGHLLTSEELRKEKTREQIALMLNEIHRIPMKGYGWLKTDFSGIHSTWSEFLANIDNLRTTERSGVLPPEDLRWLTNELAETCNFDSQACLLHGDLRKENIIINGEELSLIDFQNCFAGHALYDVGIALFFDPTLSANLAPFVPDQIVTRKDLLTILLYAARHAVSTLGHRVCVEDTEGIVEAKRRFSQLKNLYSEMTALPC